MTVEIYLPRIFSEDEAELSPRGFLTTQLYVPSIFLLMPKIKSPPPTLSTMKFVDPSSSTFLPLNLQLTLGLGRPLAGQYSANDFPSKTLIFCPTTADLLLCSPVMVTVPYPTLILGAVDPKKSRICLELSEGGFLN